MADAIHLVVGPSLREYQQFGFELRQERRSLWKKYETGLELCFMDIEAADFVMLNRYKPHGNAQMRFLEFLSKRGTCPWRIRATVRIDDSPAHTRCPPVGHHRQARAPGRSTRRRANAEHALIGEVGLRHEIAGNGHQVIVSDPSEPSFLLKGSEVLGECRDLFTNSLINPGGGFICLG